MFSRWGKWCFILANELTSPTSCVIAELFLEGSPIFTFPQLLLYRNGEYDPSLALRKIEDDEIRSLIEHMIQLDPHKRFPLSKYLDEWYAFP